MINIKDLSGNSNPLPMNNPGDQISANLFDLEIEKELLGLLIRDNNNIDKINFVKPHYFYHELHTIIFTAILALIDKKGFADVNGINAQLDGNQLFINNGGRDYLNSLMFTITIATPENRGDIISLLYTKRRIIELGRNIINDNANTPLLSIQQNLAKAEEELYHLSTERSLGGTKELRSLDPIIRNIAIHFDKARKQNKAVTGLATGFTELDTLLGGLKKTDLIILAARPSMGKSALAINIAYNVAWHNKKYNINAGTALFALEMSAEQVITRAISIHTNKSTRIFDTGRYDKETDDKIGKISDPDFEELRKSMNELVDIPLYIDDTPAITLSQLHTKLRRAKKKYSIELAIIDYLQLMRSNTATWQGNRVQEVSEITQGLKAIAKELEIPIIALSQLSRAVESRDDKRPQLSDLRESGAIEQDADIVMFLYREAYYMERTRPSEPGPEPSINDPNYTIWLGKKNTFAAWEEKVRGIVNMAEVIIAKNRNGPIGDIRLSFDRFKTRFGNLAYNNSELNEDSQSPFPLPTINHKPYPSFDISKINTQHLEIAKQFIDNDFEVKE